MEEPIAVIGLSEPRLEVTMRPLSNGATVQVARLLYPLEHERWIGHGDPLTQTIYSLLLRAHLQDAQIDAPILWLYTPMAIDFANMIPYSLLVVDVMDQLSAFKGAPRDLAQNEAMLLPVADAVFTGGMSLYRDKLPFNANTFVFPSGVEIEHFARAADPSRFPAPAPIDGMNGSPVIGYYGVIDERMDLDLLREMSSQHPDWQIVILGPVVKIDPAELPQAPNLHYPGMRRYEELPAYLAHFDVAIIPFAINESTRYLSPTKTLEYMAAHKPIVSTAIEDVRELYGEVVRIGETTDEFIAHVEQAITTRAADQHERELDILARYSWDGITEALREVLETRAAQIERRLRIRAKAASQVGK